MKENYGSKGKDRYQIAESERTDCIHGAASVSYTHLVGVLAADLSLYVSDYHAAERTFQLLTQAAGRAGRGSEPGAVSYTHLIPDALRYWEYLL